MDIENIVCNLKKYTGLKKDNEIAKLLGVSPNNFSNKKKRGTLVLDVIDWVQHENVNLVQIFSDEEPTGPIEINQASLHHLKHINRLLEILTSGTRAAEKVISDLDERYEQMELELRLEKLEEQQKPATGTETSGR